MKITPEQKEKEILNYMETLDLTREEAEQLWEDDNSDEMTPEQAELTAKAKELGRHMGESMKERKPREKVRKVDEEKKMILAEFVESLNGINAEITEVKTETEITFKYGGNVYTVKLTKHRPPKKQAVAGCTNTQS